ncbi:hypothetical protein [Microvirga brassicacearum]|uniref:Integrase n=1 Tax=Microvirga brassicacearum TaxID=2580413 RepID=A0A5N3P395_9HYPH|nr:hypothetical protein [Microvirga brassicacearum]KAB0264190.1 hypothetical protein FEZ63_24430 [Microvirga brassicacearum]
MTALIIPFVPTAQRPDRGAFSLEADWRAASYATARQNMSAFIQHNQNHANFLRVDTGSSWSDMTWYFDFPRGKTSKESATFNTVAKTKIQFPQPFLDQARAILAESVRCNAGAEPGKVMQALRIFYQALTVGGRELDMTLIDQHLLDQLGPYVEQFAKSKWYALSNQIRDIVNRILCPRSLTVYPIYYETPYKWRDAGVWRSSAIVENHKLEAEQGKSRLPHLHAIFDLATLFNNPTEKYREYNSVFTSWAVLAMFAPQRQGEITTLPTNCITSVYDEKKGRERLGLRWRPSKGAAPLTKLAVTEGWEPITTDAVSRLSTIGRTARAAAKWYQENPDQLYLPPGTEHLRGQPVTFLEIADILGWDPIDNPHFRLARSMVKALEKVGATNNPDREVKQPKARIQTVGHLALYSYESVVETSKRRVFATNIRQGPNNTIARCWFELRPDRLLMPERLAYLDGQPLTGPEVIEILQSYSDHVKPLNSLSGLRGSKLKSVGTTTDPARGVKRSTYDKAASWSYETAIYSQNSIRIFVRRFLADFIRPIPAAFKEVADWYEEHPDELHLPESLSHLRGEPLTLPEALSLIGVTPDALERPSSIRYITSDALTDVGTTRDPERGVKLETGRLALYSFESLEVFVLEMIQAQFPVVDPESNLKYSDALFCLPRNIQSADDATFWNVPFWVNYNSIVTALSGQDKKGRPGLTIFTRNGLINPKTKKPWKVATNQFRHLLNTIAQGKYLGQTLIAFWSGRKSISQNRVYDHVPQEVFIEAWQFMEEQSGVDIKVSGTLDQKAAERSMREMISYEEALRFELGAIHVTRYGLCRHDYALTPCPKDKNCIDCGESLFIAHDERMIEEAEFQIKVHQNAVESCLKAIDDEEPGVERWLKVHEYKLKRWMEALNLMTDDNTPAGTIISLSPPAMDQTRTGLAVDDAEARNPEKTPNSPASFDEDDEPVRLP